MKAEFYQTLNNFVEKLVDVIDDAGSMFGSSNAGGIARYEISKFLMYLAASDGEISRDEAQAICAIAGLDPATSSEIAKSVQQNNVYTTEFEQTVPVSFQLAVMADDKIYRSKGITASLSEDMLIVYKKAGETIINSDGAPSNQAFINYTYYTTMLEIYRNQNLEISDQNATGSMTSNDTPVTTRTASMGTKIMPNDRASQSSANTTNTMVNQSEVRTRRCRMDRYQNARNETRGAEPTDNSTTRNPQFGSPKPVVPEVKTRSIGTASHSGNSLKAPDNGTVYTGTQPMRVAINQFVSIEIPASFTFSKDPAIIGEVGGNPRMLCAVHSTEELDAAAFKQCFENQESAITFKVLPEQCFEWVHVHEATHTNISLFVSLSPCIASEKLKTYRADGSTVVFYGQSTRDKSEGSMGAMCCRYDTVISLMMALDFTKMDKESCIKVANEMLMSIQCIAPKEWLTAEMPDHLLQFDNNDFFKATNGVSIAVPRGYGAKNSDNTTFIITTKENLWRHNDEDSDTPAFLQVHCLDKPISELPPLEYADNATNKLLAAHARFTSDSSSMKVNTRTPISVFLDSVNQFTSIGIDESEDMIVLANASTRHMVCYSYYKNDHRIVFLCIAIDNLHPFFIHASFELPCDNYRRAVQITERAFLQWISTIVFLDGVTISSMKSDNWWESAING